MSERAYTYIDRAVARIGNRWLEREWDLMMGATTALVQKGDGFDWVGRRSEEYSLDCGGSAWGLMDFPEVAWSEEVDPAGAVLVMRRNCPNAQLTVRTLAFHNLPVLLRTVTLHHMAAEPGADRPPAPLAITSAVTETLPLSQAPREVTTHAFELPDELGVWQPTERCAVVAMRARALLIGREACARLGVREGAETTCEVLVDEPREVTPGQTWRLPDSFLIPVTWPIEPYAEKLYRDFVTARGEMGE